MAVKAKGSITLFFFVDIQATYRYYLLQSSTAAKPAVPTVYPPTGEWNDTEPTYTSGATNSLYYVDCTVFSDGFKYSAVSLSTSYEASKEAYNKAQNAQDTAENSEAIAKEAKTAAQLKVNKEDVEIRIETVTKLANEAKQKAEEGVAGLQEDLKGYATNESVDSKVDSVVENGVKKVATVAGYRFDDEGLYIYNTGKNTATTITEDGMYVKRTDMESGATEEEKTMLRANKDGVEAKNLEASTYLIMGGRCRFEPYDANGESRIGCFWIG